MQALTAYSYGSGTNSLAFRHRQEVRLVSLWPWQSVGPALLVVLRLCVGAGVGALAGLATGNAVFWIAIGMLSGSAVGRVADRAPPAERHLGVYQLQR